MDLFDINVHNVFAYASMDGNTVVGVRQWDAVSQWWCVDDAGGRTPVNDLELEQLMADGVVIYGDLVEVSLEAYLSETILFSFWHSDTEVVVSRTEVQVETGDEPSEVEWVSAWRVVNTDDVYLTLEALAADFPGSLVMTGDVIRYTVAP